MTTTELEKPARPMPVLPISGRMACDMCGAIYRHAIVLDSPKTPREQIRLAASRAGWKLTYDGREVCAEDAKGDAAFLIAGWADFWSPEQAIVPLQAPPLVDGDEQQPALPAVVEPAPVPAGRNPYDSPKGDAA